VPAAETEAYLVMEGRASQRIDQQLQNQLNDSATDVTMSQDIQVCMCCIFSLKFRLRVFIRTRNFTEYAIKTILITMSTIIKVFICSNLARHGDIYLNLCKLSDVNTIMARKKVNFAHTR